MYENAEIHDSPTMHGLAFTSLYVARRPSVNQPLTAKQENGVPVIKTPSTAKTENI
jgi:hypothetical protein